MEKQITWLHTPHSNVYYEVGVQRTGRWGWKLYAHTYGGGGEARVIDEFSGSWTSLSRYLKTL